MRLIFHQQTRRKKKKKNLNRSDNANCAEHTKKINCPMWSATDDSNVPDSWLSTWCVRALRLTWDAHFKTVLVVEICWAVGLKICVYCWFLEQHPYLKLCHAAQTLWYPASSDCRCIIWQSFLSFSVLLCINGHYVKTNTFLTENDALELCQYSDSFHSAKSYTLYLFIFISNIFITHLKSLDIHVNCNLTGWRRHTSTGQ